MKLDMSTLVFKSHKICLVVLVCFWESSALILAGVAVSFPCLASPKVFISGFCRTNLQAGDVDFSLHSQEEDQILRHEEKGSAQSWSLAICAGKTVQLYLHLLKRHLCSNVLT